MEKIPKTFHRPLLIFYKYYYCFLRDTSVSQIHGKQCSFYDSEVSKLWMSGKTYWSEKPDLTLFGLFELHLLGKRKGGMDFLLVFK
jgi:hypothetical protein